MFTCARVASIEYYVVTNEEAKAAQRDAMAYYTDNGAGEDDGRWIGRAAPSLGVEAGSTVDPKTLRALANGIHPGTGGELIQTNSAKRTAAYDCQFAAPKSVSALYAIGTEDQRSAIVLLHRQAVERALEFARGEGLVETRRGKGGADREAVEGMAVAAYTHTTTRAGDPQLHDHALILNVCTRADGTTGTLDNAALLRYQGAMGAVYRAELAAGIERELGLATERVDRAFRVQGVPEQLTELWSKRRDAIEQAMLEKGGGTTEENRVGAQVAALDTRDRKRDLPDREELEAKWRRELRGTGWTAEAVWSSTRDARQGRDDALANPDEEPSTQTSREREMALVTARAIATEKAGTAAIHDLEANQAVIERRHLLKEVSERMQGIGDVNAVLARVDMLLRAGDLVQVGTTEEDGEPIYATPAMVRTERSMLRSAMERRNEREYVTAVKVESVIARKVGISQEQADAVRHALNRDGVAVVEGSAGAGKSFSMGAVADAARDCGLQVHVLAPSWKAVDVIRQDTATAEEYARALRGFVNRIEDHEHPDHIQLDARSVLLVDEAGMVGTQEMEGLLRHAREAGAKVVLAGDTRQLQPVAAGSAMAAIVRECGTQRIEEIRRQRMDWQRAASADFAAGRHGEAFDAYDRAGKVAYVDGRDEAVARLAADWADDMREHPGQTRLALAYLNRDVGALNALMRTSYREAGRLAGPDVAVTAIGRGQHGTAQRIAIALGDRLIFGETVKVGGPGGTTVNNSDIGTVETVGQGPDPVLRVRLDKGTVAQGRLSEFVGRRAEDAAPETRHPKVQHAYAVSIHASQGTTVDRAYVLNSQGLKSQSAYVAMTRHREDVRLYVDAKRIEDKLQARRSGNAVRVAQGRGASAPDADDALEGAPNVTVEDVKKQLRAEFSQSEGKRNVSDFVPREGMEAWLEGMEIKPLSFPTPPAPEALDVTGVAEALDQVDAFLAPASASLPPPVRPPLPRLFVRAPGSLRRPSPPTPASPPVKVPAVPDQAHPLPRAFAPQTLRRPAVDLEQRMQARTASPVAYPPPGPPRGLEGMDPQRELDWMCRDIDFERFLESHGWRKAEAWPTTARWVRGGPHPREHDNAKRGADELMVGGGHGQPWVFSRPNKSAQGVGAIEYLQRIEGYGHGTMGRCRKEVREWVRGRQGDGTAPTTRAEAIARDLARNPAAAVPPTYDLARVRRVWADCREGVNAYLRDVRQIREEVLRRFSRHIRNEPSWEKLNKSGFCVAHLNDAGEVVGYERKGPRLTPEDKRAFSMFAKGGMKAATRITDGEPIRTVYAGESVVDLLSVYQHDGQPKGVALCSLYGETSEQAYRSVGKVAASAPSAKVHLCYDTDEAGRAMAEKAERFIRQEAPNAEIVRRPPLPDYKDWNDLLCGKSISGAAAEAERIAREEADRLRREVQARAERSPAPARAGPAPH